MGYIYEMGDSLRHSDLIAEIYRKFTNAYEALYLSKTIRPLKDNVSLCYIGKRSENELVRLISAEKAMKENLDLNLLSTIEPDFTLFYKNRYLTNQANTRVIGIPDLVVEVWSKSNTDDDKTFKKHLYSFAKESWFIEQESNIVECWARNKRIKDQSLEKTLLTSDNLQIDLRHLAL